MGGDGFGDAPVARVVQPCPLRKLHWLEIELVDGDGRPVPHARYRVTLPDGQVVEGYLDDRGRERLDPVENPGDCHVAFPDFDNRSWAPHAGS